MGWSLPTGGLEAIEGRSLQKSVYIADAASERTRPLKIAVESASTFP
jgi:hypothetical protein